MSKIGRIFLTLLGGLMIGLLTWKVFNFSMIKLNPYGFILMLIGIAIFYFSVWKTSGKSSYSLLDSISLWILIALLVFLFPQLLITLRISWFFNLIPDFGLLFLGAGISLILCVSLIHKLLKHFFANGLWILDIIHLTAPFWMQAVSPLKISLGANLVLPELFKWVSAYVYYAVVICFIIVGLLVHKKYGKPKTFLIKNKFYTIEQISLKIVVTLLMGLFIFVCTALTLKYSAEIKDLINSQNLGFTVVGGYDYRIRMAKYLFFLCNALCCITTIMIFWSWFVREIATAHTQVNLIFLPLLGGTVLIQTILFLSNKIANLFSLLNGASQYIPYLKKGSYIPYFLYALLALLSYILVRGLLLPHKEQEVLPTEIKKDDTLEDSGWL